MATVSWADRVTPLLSGVLAALGDEVTSVIAIPTRLRWFAAAGASPAVADVEGLDVVAIAAVSGDPDHSDTWWCRGPVAAIRQPSGRGDGRPIAVWSTGTGPPLFARLVLDSAGMIRGPLWSG